MGGGKQKRSKAPTPEEEAARALQMLSHFASSTDIAWIESAPSRVRTEIDGNFSSEIAYASQLKGLDKQLARARGDKKVALEDKRAELVAGGTEAFDDDIVKEGRLEGAESWDPAIWENVRTRVEGRAASRIDFMGQMVSLFGSASAVKDHFNAITPSSAPGRPWMSAKAGDRLEAAHKAFEAEHGVPFLDSDVAFDLRARHHSRQSAGMLAHATGLAIDFRAHSNPHLKGTDTRVAIESGAGNIGKARLELEDRKGDEYSYGARRGLIARAGAATEAGTALDADAARLVGEELKRAYEGFSEVDQRFRAALDRNGDGHDDEVASLHAVGEQYWAARSSIRKAQGAEASARKALPDARKKGAERLKKARLGELKAELGDAKKAASARREDGSRPTRAEIAADPAVAAATEALATYRQAGPTEGEIAAEAGVIAAQQRLDDAVAGVAALRAPIDAALGPLVAPWSDAISDRMALAEAKLGGLDPAALPPAKPLDAAVAALKKGLGRRKWADADRDALLERLRADPDLEVWLEDADEEVLDDPALLRAHLTEARARLGQATKDAASWAALARARDRVMHDLDFVLGASARPTVKDPSLLQVAERGLIYDEEGKLRADGGTERYEARVLPDDAGEAYFEAFTRTMMEHGFESGGAWSSADTMHFELVEGFSAFTGGTHGPLG